MLTIVLHSPQGEKQKFNKQDCAPPTLSKVKMGWPHREQRWTGASLWKRRLTGLWWLSDTPHWDYPFWLERLASHVGCPIGVRMCWPNIQVSILLILISSLTGILVFRWVSWSLAKCKQIPTSLIYFWTHTETHTDLRTWKSGACTSKMTIHIRMLHACEVLPFFMTTAFYLKLNHTF